MQPQPQVLLARAEAACKKDSVDYTYTQYQVLRKTLIITQFKTYYANMLIHANTLYYTITYLAG